MRRSGVDLRGIQGGLVAALVGRRVCGSAPERLSVIVTLGTSGI